MQRFGPVSHHPSLTPSPRRPAHGSRTSSLGQVQRAEDAHAFQTEVRVSAVLRGSMYPPRWAKRSQLVFLYAGGRGSSGVKGEKDTEKRQFIDWKKAEKYLMERSGLLSFPLLLLSARKNCCLKVESVCFSVWDTISCLFICGDVCVSVPLRGWWGLQHLRGSTGSWIFFLNISIQTTSSC